MPLLWYLNRKKELPAVWAGQRAAAFYAINKTTAPPFVVTKKHCA